MGKSLKNAVAPDDIYRDYGADTLRLYEMFMGPLDASRPWNTADIIGVHRFLQRLWRNVSTRRPASARVDAEPADDETRRLLHRTIDAVRDDMDDAGVQHRDRAAVRAEQPADPGRRRDGRGAARGRRAAGADGRAARAAHRRGAVGAARPRPSTLAYETFPTADPAWLVDDTVEIPVQVNGKVRGPADACRPAPTKPRPKPRRGPTSGSPRCSTGKTVRKVDRRARPPRQLRRRLSRARAGASAVARKRTRAFTHVPERRPRAGPDRRRAAC